MKMLLIIAFLLFAGNLPAQLPQQQDAFSCHCPSMVKPGKGKFYISYGYNLDWFSKSDIHFKDKTTDDYDFTLFDVKAEDRPGIDEMFSTDITIPQYSYRFGYFLNDKYDLGFEINYDHVKYVMIQNQRAHMKGEIHGENFDTDTLLVNDFIRYEHTNGANYIMIKGIKRQNFLHSKNEKHWLSGIVKIGAGIVLPRSDTRIFGNRKNDTYHVAGYVAGIDLGLRYDFLKHFFVETSGKGAFANYSNVFLYGDGKASQHWTSFEFIFTAGYQFRGKLF